MRFIVLLVLICLAVIPSGTIATWGKFSGGRQRYRNTGFRASRNSYPNRYTSNGNLYGSGVGYGSGVRYGRVVGGYGSGGGYTSGGGYGRLNSGDGYGRPLGGYGGYVSGNNGRHYYSNSGRRTGGSYYG